MISESNMINFFYLSTTKAKKYIVFNPLCILNNRGF